MNETLVRILVAEIERLETEKGHWKAAATEARSEAREERDRAIRLDTQSARESRRAEQALTERDALKVDLQTSQDLLAATRGAYDRMVNALCVVAGYPMQSGFPLDAVSRLCDAAVAKVGPTPPPTRPSEFPTRVWQNDDNTGPSVGLAVDDGTVLIRCRAIDHHDAQCVDIDASPALAHRIGTLLIEAAREASANPPVPA